MYVDETRRLVGLDPPPKSTSWIEGAHAEDGKIDDTAWEVGHFLKMATQCNPTILEVFTAPVVEATVEGHELRALWYDLWDPARVRDAFIGYGNNQRKKMLEARTDPRWRKFAVAYLRVLHQAHVLLTLGTLIVDMRGQNVYDRLARWRKGEMTPGEVIDVCSEKQASVEAAARLCSKVPSLDRANQFLADVRWRHFG